MAILNAKPSDSSTDGSHSDSDEDEKRFYKNPSSARQASSTSESDALKSSGHGDRVASSASKPNKAAQTKVQDPSPSVKTKREKPGKRNREDESGQEQASAKKKNAPKKADTGKKPESSGQLETLDKGRDGKTPVKPLKENKKSSVTRDSSKRRKQAIQEAVGTTPAKDSVRKSGKKFQRVWSDKDEMTFARGLLACFSQGNDPAKNVVQVQQHIKDSMEHDYSKGQMYEKTRRLKQKYQNIRDKLKEDAFSFKSPHEKSLFKICEQLWGEKPGADEDEDMDETRSKDVGNVAHQKVSSEEDDAVAGGEDSQEQDEEVDQEGGNPAHGARENGKEVQMNGNDSSAQQNNSVAWITEVRSECEKMIEAAQSRATVLVETLFKAATDSLQRGGVGTPLSSVLSISNRNRELMDGMFSVNVLPSLDTAKVEMLEKKWREQHIMEMEVLSRRLDILQEECKICLKGLKAPTGSVGS